jgi:hypothetical protein
VRSLKSLSEKIQWYCEKEQRLWKRIYHFIEIAIISMSATSLVVLIQMNGDGTKLQAAITVFIAAIAASSASLMPVILKSKVLNRWQTQTVTLGLGCGVGISTICTLLLLELQLSSL